MIKNVKCNGETVTQIVNGSGTKLADLTAEVENESSYVLPTTTNVGGELEAGSTIAAGTYFSGAATVPSGSGESNPITKCSDAVKITKATTYDGTEIPANSLVVPLEEGLKCVYVIHTKTPGTGRTIERIILARNGKYGVLFYSNNMGGPSNISMNLTTNSA